MSKIFILYENNAKKLLKNWQINIAQWIIIRVVHYQLLFFIFFWHLRKVCEMKTKKSSQNLYDGKKYEGVATGNYDNFTLVFIILILLL